MLAAVTIGGGAFGVLGMLLGVPVCSVIYTLLQNFVRTAPEELSPAAKRFLAFARQTLRTDPEAAELGKEQA